MTAQINLDKAATRLVDIDTQIEALEQEKKTIKEAILNLYENGSYEAGDLTVKVRAGARRLNQTRFQKAYPPADHPEYYAHKLNTTAIRSAFAREELEAYQDEGARQVIVQ